MRTSRRGASSGATISSGTRWGLWGLRLERRRRRRCGLGLLLELDPVLLPLFLKNDPSEQHRADTHRAVGDVEGPESDATRADVDEVHHTERRANAVDQVPRRAAPREAERERLEPLGGRRVAVQVPERDERDDRE